VEVAEVLVFERGRLALAPAGEDVTALVVHVGTPPRVCFCKFLRGRGLGDRGIANNAGWLGRTKIPGLKPLDSRLLIHRFYRALRANLFLPKTRKPGARPGFFLSISSLAISGEIVGKIGAGFFSLDCVG
jgi:hypothetical protein